MSKKNSDLILIEVRVRNEIKLEVWKHLTHKLSHKAFLIVISEKTVWLIPGALYCYCSFVSLVMIPVSEFGICSWELWRHSVALMAVCGQRVVFVDGVRNHSAGSLLRNLTLVTCISQHQFETDDPGLLSDKPRLIKTVSINSNLTYAFILYYSWNRKFRRFPRKKLSSYWRMFSIKFLDINIKRSTF